MGRLKKCLNVKIIFAAIIVSFAVSLAFAVRVGAVDLKSMFGTSVGEKYPEYSLLIETGKIEDTIPEGKIKNIIIQYYDTQGNIRNYSIDGKTVYESKPQELSAAEQGELNQAKILSNISSVGKANYPSAGIASGSVYQIRFKPYYEIGEKGVISIDFVTDRSGFTWNIDSVKLVKTDDYLRLMRYSNFSKEYFFNVKGELICYMTGKTFSVDSSSNTPGRTLGLEGDSRLVNTTKEQRKEEYSFYNPDTDRYFLKIDLADIYNGGYEVNSRIQPLYNRIDENKFAEMMAVRFMYVTTDGEKKSVTVPVISNYLQWCKLRDSKGCQDSQVIGIAQQGDSMLVELHLPKFAELYINDSEDGKLQITSGIKKVEEVCNIKWINEEVKEAFVNKSNSLGDDAYVTGIGFYKYSDDVAKLDLSNGTATTKLTDSNTKPMYYYYSDKEDGTKVSIDTTIAVDMKNYREGASFNNNKNLSNTYYMEIDTDSMTNATSGGKLNIAFTYIDSAGVYSTGTESRELSDLVEGSTKTSTFYDVDELTKSFYGYWPAQNSDGSDDKGFARRLGMQSGKTLKFFVNINDLDKVTKMTFDLSGESTDWQIKGMRMYAITSMGERKITFPEGGVNVSWEEGNAQKSSSSKALFERNVIIKGTAPLFDYNDRVLIKSGTSVTVNIGNSASVVERKRDKNPMGYGNSLDFEVANSGLDFTSVRGVYNITVKVADSESGNSTDGDCGSRNLFYFRLNFKNGSSGYVLANMQLKSDGFRTGEKEEFTIRTNQDYGELVSVDIVPDNTSSSSNIYDKLNIEYIKVKSSTADAMVKTWNINDIKWIGIEYAEDNASKGHTAAQITKTYPVSSTSYGVDLEFVITNDEYDVAGSDNSNKDNSTAILTGNVDAMIYYKDSSGKTVSTERFNVTELYYQYDKISYSKDKETPLVPNSSYMYRAGTQDRFLYTLDDAKSIEKIEFYVKEYKVGWNISKVAVNVVTELGELVINDHNEYEYDGKKEKLTCDSSNVVGKKYSSKPSNNESKITIGFNDNTINTKTGEADKIEITSVPTSKDDNVNIYIYPKDTSNLGTYNMKATLDYKNVYGKTFRAKISSFDVSDKCLYKIGCSTAELASIYALHLQAVNGDNIGIDKVIIQHTRDGVQISLHELKYNMSVRSTTPTSNTYTSASAYGTKRETDETQKVRISIGGNSKLQTKIGENDNDLAVALHFKSSLGGDNTEYRSEYKFISENSKYTKIAGNMMLEMDFNIPYMAEITGISLVNMSGIEIPVSAALVETYTNDKSSKYEKNSDDYKSAISQRTLTGWYSFRGEFTPIADNDTKLFRPYSDSVGANNALGYVEISLEMAGNVNSSETSTLFANISYVGSANESLERYINNLYDYMGFANGYEAGDIIVVPLLVEDFNAVKNINLKPMGVNAMVSIKSIKVASTLGSRRASNIVNLTQPLISNSGQDISFIGEKMDVKLNIYDINNKQKTVIKGTNGNISATLSQGDRVVLDVDYTSSIGGGYSGDYKGELEVYLVGNSGTKILMQKGVNHYDYTYDQNIKRYVFSTFDSLKKDGDKDVVDKGLQSGYYEIQLKSQVTGEVLQVINFYLS